LKTQFPKVAMIALMATATQRVQTDLKEMLQVSRCVTFVSSVNRPNLFYEVWEKSSNGIVVIDDVANFIRGSYQNKESGIVYCFTWKECEQVAKELWQRGIQKWTSMWITTVCRSLQFIRGWKLTTSRQGSQVCSPPINKKCSKEILPLVSLRNLWTDIGYSNVNSKAILLCRPCEV